MTSRGIYQGSGRPPAPEDTRGAATAFWLDKLREVMVDRPELSPAEHLGVRLLYHRAGAVRPEGYFRAHWFDVDGGHHMTAPAESEAAAVAQARHMIAGGVRGPSVADVAARRWCSVVGLERACGGKTYRPGVWTPVRSDRLPPIHQDRVSEGGAVV